MVTFEMCSGVIQDVVPHRNNKEGPCTYQLLFVPIGMPVTNYIQVRGYWAEIERVQKSEKAAKLEKSAFNSDAVADTKRKRGEQGYIKYMAMAAKYQRMAHGNLKEFKEQATVHEEVAMSKRRKASACRNGMCLDFPSSLSYCCMQ